MKCPASHPCSAICFSRRQAAAHPQVQPRQGLASSVPQTHDEACPLRILLRNLLGLNSMGVLSAEGELSNGHIIQVDVEIGSPLSQDPADVPADNLQWATVRPGCACSTAERLPLPPAGVNAGMAPGVPPVPWMLRQGSWETQQLAAMHKQAASSMAKFHSEGHTCLAAKVAVLAETHLTHGEQLAGVVLSNHALQSFLQDRKEKP